MVTTPAVTAQKKVRTRSTEYRPPKGVARLYFRFVDHQNKDFVRSVSSLTDASSASVVRVVTAELDVRQR